MTTINEIIRLMADVSEAAEPIVETYVKTNHGRLRTDSRLLRLDRLTLEYVARHSIGMLATLLDEMVRLHDGAEITLHASDVTGRDTIDKAAQWLAEVQGILTTEPDGE